MACLHLSNLLYILLLLAINGHVYVIGAPPTPPPPEVSSVDRSATTSTPTLPAPIHKRLTCKPPSTPPDLQRRDSGDNADEMQHGESSGHLTGNWSFEDLSSTSHLVKRIMTLPGTDMDAFMVQEVGEAAQVVWSAPGIRYSSRNTALGKSFGPVAESAGSSHLCGCTCLIIVSRKGYYFAHYWEYVAFSPDAGLGFRDANDAIQRTVLDPLRNGYSWGQTEMQASLPSVASLIDDPSLRAFFVTPRITDQEVPDGYRHLLDQIKTVVGSIMPRLNPSNTNVWQDLVYDPLPEVTDRPTLDNTARGRVLLKFDPGHRRRDPRNKLTLWSEHREVFNDEW